MTDPDLPVAERLVQLLNDLGIERAHVAGAVPGDWRSLTTSYADRLASLSLVCPTGFDPSAVSSMTSRVLVFHGDRGPTAERVRAGVARVPGAEMVTLADYAGLPFADVAAERCDEIAPRLLTFVARLGQKRPTSSVTLAPGSGEVAGISYRIEGSGPPLVLLPLSLAPSQWDPLLPRLREHFCTIALGGPHLGIMPGVRRLATCESSVTSCRRSRSSLPRRCSTPGAAPGSSLGGWPSTPSEHIQSRLSISTAISSARPATSSEETGCTTSSLYAKGMPKPCPSATTASTSLCQLPSWRKAMP